MSDIENHTEVLQKLGVAVDAAALAKMVKTYALAVSNVDGRYVACGDESERNTVRDNFLKKKLGLTLADAELDQAVLDICQKMKEIRMKHRVIFYYLLALKYDKLSVFGGESQSA